MTSPHPSDRAALRAALRLARRAFVADGTASLHLVQPLRDVMASSLCIAGYAPMGGEPDPLPFLDWCHGQGLATALPYLAGRGAVMRLKRWSPGDPLDKAGFGFMQPREDADDVIPDCVLVPLVGFDAMGNRMGQGAGHYDRYFAAHPTPHRIGIAWECQRVAALPVEAWDVPMHAVLTETGWHDVSAVSGQGI
jgi:5-formyltetrahydrofolate cyclo-ligase